MNAFRSVLDSVAAQQDFLWFCALLGWIAAGAMLHLHRKSPALADRRRWLQVVTACGALLAAGEIGLHSLPPQIDWVEQLHWDAIMNALQTVQAVALVLVMRGEAPRARWSRWGLAAAAALLCAGRLYYFAPCGAALLGLGIAAVFFTRRDPGWDRLAWLCALAPFVGTTGLLAEWMGVSRRWVELSPFAFPSACWQFATAAVAVGLLGKKHGWVPRAAPAAPMPDELKLFLKVTAVWLAFGLMLAIWTGRQARHAFEESMLSRVRAAALVINPAHVVRVLTDLSLDRADFVPQSGGRRGRIFRVPALILSGLPLRLDLTKVHRVNPDLYWTLFLTIRDGRLVAAALPQHLPARKDVVVMYGEVSPAEQTAWDSRASYFETPFTTDYGSIVRARAPIVDDQGHMLGWVAFENGAVHWAVAQAAARLQTLSVVGIGVVLALFINLLRLDQQERRRVELAAIAAFEGDRAKTAFLAKVSHELRSPIQGILGFSELLTGQVLSAEGKRWLRAVRFQGQLLIRLVNDLIDLSALQSGAFSTMPQSANLAELVRGTADSLTPRAESKGLVLLVEIQAGMPGWLYFDAERVRQVLHNLLSNALKFTERGEVRVRLTAISPPGASACLVELRVIDTGPGIAPEDQPRLFRPFTRLEQHKGVEGAGLGLALSAAICQRMGGSLRVESDGVRGSAFIASLPLRITEAPPAATVWAPPSNLVGLRVLVADDNPMVRELFATSLRQAGAWVDEASDGLEAVEICAKQDFRVVVLDVSMPWLNGFEAARRIKAVSRETVRVIGVSAHAGAAEKGLATAAGMAALLTKPLPIPDLLNVVAGIATDPTAHPRATPSDLALLRKLRQQFEAEAPRIATELQEALASADRRWLRARAHYLRNSADVTGFPEISLLCAQLEAAALEATADPAPLVAELVRALRSRPPLSSDNPPDINPNS
ncbi:MAG TPA: ATP-binding protein [Lacunisphaera sp.]